ncbi:MAG: hypothetical protein D6692_09230 [Planctomycetota bacterium]|nr:MAG: hypothetical protein D6692_09230 [Planctomycetota bacterium]
MPTLARFAKSLSLLALLAISACTTTWQDHYRGVPAGVYEPTPEVTLREVPWPRIDATLQSIRDKRAASDTHWDEWTSEQKLEEQAELLSGLQISEDPQDIIVLGRSVFRSTDRLRPDDGSLAKFARSLGADYAVWSAHYIGTKEVVQQEPVYESGWSSRGYRDSHGHYRRDFVPWDRTVFVPVVVEADEYVWVVYFLRKR